jgi:hypothetical protein
VEEEERDQSHHHHYMDKEENGTDLPPEIEVQTASHSCLGLKGWVLILSGVLLLLGALGTFAVAFVVVKRCTYIM